MSENEVLVWKKGREREREREREKLLYNISSLIVKVSQSGQQRVRERDLYGEKINATVENSLQTDIDNIANRQRSI